MFRSPSMLGKTALCLFSALLLAACGGDKSSEDTSSGGRSSGTGGASSGAGGPSSGGSGGAAPTSGGSGGGGGVVAYACDAKAPPSANLTGTIDTSGKWGDSVFGGGAFVYGDGPDTDAIVDIAIDYTAKNMHITGKVASYTGFGLWFGPVMGQTYPCVDASSYKGVSFSISDAKGTVSDITFQIQTHGTAPVDTKNLRGGCEFKSEATKYSDCLFPSASVSVPASGGAIETTWDQFMGGKPEPTVNPKGLDGLQWQFPWTDGATEYEVDITVSDVKFF